jgi:hypothetical protein
VNRIAAIAAAAALTTGFAAGCGGDSEEETPQACLGTAASYREALAAAPGDVALADGTAISDCLPAEQTSGELAQSGEVMIAAATDLNADARTDPTGPAAVQLGFLVGAIERGADSIHADLVRRVNSAARFSPGGGVQPPEFERTFGQGYSAGLESG